MYTLKLYNNAAPGVSRTVILETAGLWVDNCLGGVKHIRAFKNEVGVEPCSEFYVGGEIQPEQDAIHAGIGGNYYTWGVLENQYGKTTEMFR